MRGKKKEGKAEKERAQESEREDMKERTREREKMNKETMRITGRRRKNHKASE